MKVSVLRIFIISILASCATVPASACIGEPVERWYMYDFNSPSFRDYFQDENFKYWSRYCAPDQQLYWVSVPTLKKVAEKRHDVSTLEYLDALDSYEKISREISADSWDYPTAAQLAQRRRTLAGILSQCKAHQSGPLASRWLLLEMRANMLNRNYASNISLWEQKGIYASAGYVKEMMRNIYANALLNSGRKMDAWNIYSDQNDNESLLWSARKYTNLAGIKNLYHKYPDAPVHKYILKKYVNTLQDVADMHSDIQKNSYMTMDEALADYRENVGGKAYAPIDKNYMKEIKDFVTFADSVANVKTTVNPCMWETAAALCSYFIGAYAPAKAMTDKAMAMTAPKDTKDMARRIRMLIATSADDINSVEFKRFMADELAWLDREIAGNDNSAPVHARDRILNLGLARNYASTHHDDMACLMDIYRDYIGSDPKYIVTPMTYDIYPKNSTEIQALFNILADPGSDPLARYAASKIKLPEDFKNDILGTKYLQEGKWAEALPYLKKVSMEYLNNQPIAFYAARRDYTIPAWNGFQSVGDNNYEETSKPQHLTRNVKVDFCNDMIRLTDEAARATQNRRDSINLELATALYQASRFGQCWYLSQYGYSCYEDSTVTDNELAGLAIDRLEQCAKSSDAKVKAAALFGLIAIAPDNWISRSWDWSGNSPKEVVTINRNSRQYAAIDRLSAFLETHPSATLPEISRCDVMRQWRKYRSRQK